MSDEIRFNDDLLIECDNVLELHVIMATLIIAKFNEDRRVDLLRSPVINKWIKSINELIKKNSPIKHAGDNNIFVSYATPEPEFSEIIDVIFKNRDRMLNGIEGADQFEAFLSNAFYPLELSGDQMVAAKKKLGFGK